jgi:hypothetical protein
MKTKKTTAIKALVLLALSLTLALAFTACSKSGGGSGGGGGKSLNSATELKEYLDKQPANSPDQPIKVAMKANEMMIKDIAKVISEAGKYVSLNLSGSPLTEIPDEAFKNCKTLSGIIIPSSVTSIGVGAFSDTAWLNSQPDGLVYLNKILVTYKGTMPANTVIDIRADTIAIADYAFSSKENLTSVTIPSSVTFIGEGVFMYCTSLTSITIPSSVTSIGEEAFADCTSLASITIPSSVTFIGFRAFYGCDSLTSVTFEGTIAKANLNGGNGRVFYGDLENKYLAGGIGTYTTTAPVYDRHDRRSTWTKQ